MQLCTFSFLALFALFARVPSFEGVHSHTYSVDWTPCHSCTAGEWRSHTLTLRIARKHFQGDPWLWAHFCKSTFHRFGCWQCHSQECHLKRACALKCEAYSVLSISHWCPTLAYHLKKIHRCFMGLLGNIWHICAQVQALRSFQGGLCAFPREQVEYGCNLVGVLRFSTSQTIISRAAQIDVILENTGYFTQIQHTLSSQ